MSVSGGGLMFFASRKGFDNLICLYCCSNMHNE